MFTKYKETLDFLFSQLPMYQRIGSAAYKKDLTNTLLLCNHLHDPQNKIKTIHIAGTNGKGTVSHLIAYALQKQGLKVGLYTSPHYKDFRERIKINGEFIPKKAVTQFVNDNIDKIREIKPSFFEITAVMAFDYFHKSDVDVAIIEVGLGGRLDSTNVITPLLSVITNISFDHMDMLGDTLEKIAFEKAGIIKKNIPVVIGEKQKDIKHVFEAKAASENTKLSYAENKIKIISDSVSTIQRKIKLKIGNTDIFLKTTLTAPYHLKNLMTAFGALRALEKHFNINYKKIEKGFIQFSDKIKYWGRWQIVDTKPVIILDSAHNEAGIKQALNQLKSYQAHNIHFILGFVKDKDIDKILALFPKTAKYYFCKARIPRGLDANELQKKCTEKGLFGKAYKSVSSAFNAAKMKAKSKDVIYVGGSIFVTAEVL